MEKTYKQNFEAPSTVTDRPTNKMEKTPIPVRPTKPKTLTDSLKDSTRDSTLEDVIRPNTGYTPLRNEAHQQYTRVYDLLTTLIQITGPV
nr:hypothetical protein BgiMline_015729 [Biomphalaria glabrata]